MRGISIGVWLVQWQNSCSKQSPLCIDAGKLFLSPVLTQVMLYTMGMASEQVQRCTTQWLVVAWIAAVVACMRFLSAAWPAGSQQLLACRLGF
jgi:hypothetical protein